MGTTFAEILTNAMYFIDDARWQEQLASNPAQFYRAKSAYVARAVPRFNCPPNIQSYLGYTAPSYADYGYTAETAQESGFTVETEITGYELCSVSLESSEPYGTPVLTLLPSSYDAETGVVTVNAAVSAGDSLSIDFYTDGVFDNELDDAQKRILALAAAADWYFHFANAYLGVANLVTDKSFSLKSPSEHIKANTERMKYLQEQLRSEIFAYEQRLYKAQFVPSTQLPRV